MTAQRGAMSATAAAALLSSHAVLLGCSNRTAAEAVLIGAEMQGAPAAIFQACNTEGTTLQRSVVYLLDDFCIAVLCNAHPAKWQRFRRLTCSVVDVHGSCVVYDTGGECIDRATTTPILQPDASQAGSNRGSSHRQHMLALELAARHCEVRDACKIENAIHYVACVLHT